MLEVNNLNFSYSKKATIKNLSFKINNGEFVGIIGPNGSGKSTLLKNIYRSLEPDSGEILLEKEDLLKMSFKKSARKMAVVGQENHLNFNFIKEVRIHKGNLPRKFHEKI